MQRNYAESTAPATPVTMFVGNEVEHTAAYKAKTLFVVGTHNADDVISQAFTSHCEHIYFGANMSFGVDDATTVASWEAMFDIAMQYNLWITLDIESSQLATIDAFRKLREYCKFVLTISVKIPNIRQLPYAACLKIDDVGFNQTNPGVWVHTLASLQTTETFTGWQDYSDDEITK
jgi:hypothetical protein